MPLSQSERTYYLSYFIRINTARYKESHIICIKGKNSRYNRRRKKRFDKNKYVQLKESEVKDDNNNNNNNNNNKSCFLLRKS